ncbi:MAG: hypothetical protein C5B60_01475 [Chloroflexi bacterium]|nr:MAG: hypothetical protein C5B60_01475 [Chloroflexota bacterium]
MPIGGGFYGVMNRPWPTGRAESQEQGGGLPQIQGGGGDWSQGYWGASAPMQQGSFWGSSNPMWRNLGRALPSGWQPAASQFNPAPATSYNPNAAPPMPAGMDPQTYQRWLWQMGYPSSYQPTPQEMAMGGGGMGPPQRIGPRPLPWQGPLPQPAPGVIPGVMGPPTPPGITGLPTMPPQRIMPPVGFPRNWGEGGERGGWGGLGGAGSWGKGLEANRLPQGPADPWAGGLAQRAPIGGFPRGERERPDRDFPRHGMDDRDQDRGGDRDRIGDLLSGRSRDMRTSGGGGGRPRGDFRGSVPGKGLPIRTRPRTDAKRRR